MSKRMTLATTGLCTALVMAPCWTTDVAGARSMTALEASAIRPRSALRADSSYTDGVYTANGQYGNLPSSITVTATLVDSVITAVKVTPHATDPTSLDLQRRFAAAIPKVVVGKRIDEAKVGRLAGSSGTPKGFNAAIRRIKEQAAAHKPAG
jgi:uncharacterized protein with FMN-binding domain